VTFAIALLIESCGPALRLVWLAAVVGVRQEHRPAKLVVVDFAGSPF
jgi:hypothetical protein